MLALIPAMSFSQALSTFVGQNIGANKPERIKAGLIATIKMSGIVTIVTTIFIVIWGHVVMKMFTNDTEVIRLGDQYLTIMFIYNGVTRGAGDTLFPMLFSILSLWIIRIPFAWYFSGKIGVIGIWWSIPAGWAVGLALSYFYYKSGRWKNKAVVKYVSN